MRRKKGSVLLVMVNDMAWLIFRKASSRARLGVGLIDWTPFRQWSPNHRGEEQGKHQEAVIRRNHSGLGTYWSPDGHRDHATATVSFKLLLVIFFFPKSVPYKTSKPVRKATGRMKGVAIGKALVQLSLAACVTGSAPPTCRGLIWLPTEVVGLDFQMHTTDQAGIAILSFAKCLLKIRKVQQLDGHPMSS